MKDIHTYLFGLSAGRSLSGIDALAEEVSNSDYFIMSESSFRKLSITDPSKANRVYVRELLQRAHLTATVSVLRSRAWIRGTVEAADDKNVLAFAACLRALIEASADSQTGLQGVPTTLARDHSVITSVLREEFEGIFLAPEIEDQLIHFSHASKAEKSKKEPPTHRAKTIRQYLEILEEGQVEKIVDLYSRLCDITHPGASSVFKWIVSKNGEHLNIITDRDEDVIDAIRADYGETLEQVVMFAFTGALLTFGVLNYFELPNLHTKIMRKYTLDGIPVWRKLQRDYLSNKKSLVAGSTAN